ncbi:MAG: Hsp20/alpha crystallin family protein [Phycisphaerales bacterium]|nr:Hsp20/alpha crystallin family protein [Phycisphaerales bacterium]
MMNLTNMKNNAVDPVRDLFSAVIGDVANCCSGTGARARMALDIVENEHTYEILASMPGFAAEDVAIDLENGVLSITATRCDTADEDGQGNGGCCGGGNTTASNHLRRERFAGTFARTIRLPENIDENGLTAGLDNGVLTVTVPKVALPQARRIEIA